MDLKQSFYSGLKLNSFIWIWILKTSLFLIAYQKHSKCEAANNAVTGDTVWIHMHCAKLPAVKQIIS